MPSSILHGSQNTVDNSQVTLSIVVPTYQEQKNLPELIKRISKIKPHFKALELIIVDDDSQDGTEEYIQSVAYDWVILMVRRNKRGLSSAVVDGFKRARHAVLVCMDGDLSHPVHAICEMTKCIQNPEVDLVVGSRFIEGGTIDEAWSLASRLNAWIAKFLARPLVQITDPLSGFFCLRKTTFDSSDQLNPIGYKIGLELIVKCRCKHIREIPIHFSERLHGKSKLNLKERFNYLRHLAQLWLYKRRVKVNSARC